MFFSHIFFSDSHLILHCRIVHRNLFFLLQRLYSSSTHPPSLSLSLSLSSLHSSPPVISSSSRRDYTVSLAEGGIQTLSYSWRQTISFESCQHDQGVRPPPSSQQLSVDQVFVMYDTANQLIRYAMSNKIGSIHSESRGSLIVCSV